MPMFDPRFPAFEVDAGGCNHYTDEDPWNGHKPLVFALLNYLRPRTVWELGTQDGNSFFSFCHAAALIGDVDPTYTDVQLHAVDTWAGDAHIGHYTGIYEKVSRYAQAHFPDNAHLWRMSFDDALAHCEDGSVDLLHIDGLHTYEAVRHDFESWLPKLSRRGVVLFHDVVERQRDFGVYRLWAELTEHYPAATLSHSHGLGILLVGSDVPDRLAALVAVIAECPERATKLLQRRSAFALLAAWFPADAGWQPAVTNGNAIHVANDNLAEEDRRITAALVACRDELSQAREELARAHGEIEVDRAAIEAIYGSRSWRITAPLRWIGARVRRAGD